MRERSRGGQSNLTRAKFMDLLIHDPPMPWNKVFTPTQISGTSVPLRLLADRQSGGKKWRQLQRRRRYWSTGSCCMSCTNCGIVRLTRWIRVEASHAWAPLVVSPCAASVEHAQSISTAADPAKSSRSCSKLLAKSVL